MKQKKMMALMMGILTTAIVMTGCSGESKTAAQIDYGKNTQKTSEQTERKVKQADKDQKNKGTAGKKENTSQAANDKRDVSGTSQNTDNAQNSDDESANNGSADTDVSQNVDMDNSASENNNSTGTGEDTSGQNADQAMIYDSDGNGRLISQAGDGNWYDSDGNCYGNWEDIEDAMQNETGVFDQDGNQYYWIAPHDASEEVTDPYDLYSWDSGTNSYIPFQQAETDGSPVGRGNGWYYYDKNSGEYVPW